MRFMLFGLAALVASAAASAQVYVHGYTTKNGTYVAPHYRSAPDGNPYNNWSTVGNVNPYTGQPGTKNPYGSSSYGAYGIYSNPYAPSSNQRSSNQQNSSNSQSCLYSWPC